MIERLVINSLGVIEQAAIEFHPGFTVITGETGAGKTMVLTGFAWLAGAKTDPALVRTGAAQASVEGEWLVDERSEPALRLIEAGAELEVDLSAGERARLLVARTLAAEGRSRAVAGGRGVPAVVLQEASAGLLAVHGQAEQLRLRAPGAQRDLLDRFAGEAGAQAHGAYAASFERWRAVRAELHSLQDAKEARERESAMLSLGIAEIEAVAPVLGEDDELATTSAVLQHAGSLRSDLEAAHDALVGGDSDREVDAMTLLTRALDLIDRSAVLDPTLGASADRLRELTRVLPDLASDLASYAAGIDADPARQAWVEERRAELGALKRRYGASLDDVVAWLEQARATVSRVAGDADHISALGIEERELSAQTLEAGRRLSQIRREAAVRLADAVTAELQVLAMPEASFHVMVSSSDSLDDSSAAGLDAIEMLLRPHAGADPRPITRGASGGELSRVMLGIEVALAGADPVPTFVFDEVDAGIGGRTAIEVGRRLARLARTAQVIVVTHLPQVAAFADRQVVVTKGREGAVTATSTRIVDGDARVDELVRMLSGLEATDAGAAHARELLAVAEAERGAIEHRLTASDGGDVADVTTRRPRVTKSRTGSR